MRKKNVYLLSLGCPKNQVDSEVTLGALADAGLTPVNNGATADILLVNTCGFINDAKEESIEIILEMAEEKKRRPGAILAVMGCLTERYRDELAKDIPEIDYIFGVAELPAILEKLAPLEGAPPDPDKTERFVTPGAHSAYIKIADGCSNNCSFCVIPAIRGSYISRPLEEIIAEAKKLAARGILELIVVAQDTTLYGADLKISNGLATLLEALEKVDGIMWIRVMYLYPALIDDTLLDRFARSDKIVPYFDIPLQHASDSILKKMKRPETNFTIKRLISAIRAKVAGAAIRTSFIVGFPGESEVDFEILKDLVIQTRFEHMGAFIWSPEEGTAAFDLPDRVSHKTAKWRFEELMRLQRTIAISMAQARIGEVIQALVDPPDISEKLLTARTKTQAPDIDGSVILDEVEAKPGDLLTLKIIGATDYDLIGTRA